MTEAIQREIPQPPKSITINKKKKIVAQKNDFNLLTRMLQRDDKQLLIIPITGPPGLGKTTLAKSIYEDPIMKSHFDVCAWVTVSQGYTYHGIFSEILNSLKNKTDRDREPFDYTHCDEYKLNTCVHQQLYNRRYLLVIDGELDGRVFFRVKFALPETQNGSRILVTMNNISAAKSIQPVGYIHKMKPLSLEDSLELLCEIVFGDDACPPQLKEIGQRIAKRCKGVPLSITVVGDLLLRRREDVEHWKRIEEDSFCQEIWSLRYNYLPDQLRGCFFYMGWCWN